MLAFPLLAALGSPTNASTWYVIVDCGSSGTRVHIYYYHDLASIEEFTPPLQHDADRLETTPGISSFAGDPAGTTEYFALLLEQAARWVPHDQQSHTRVRALATAGMRMLSEAEQQPIWRGVDAAISASPFAFVPGSSQTIVGEYEGACSL